MKNKEEIEQLADKAINKEGYTTDDFIIGFEQGYTQCQEDVADKKYTYKEMRAFAVDFAYYIYGNDLGNLSHERHKQLFDEWIEAKLPQAVQLT